VQRSVSVPGHTPCDSPDDCKEGHCDIPTETCVPD
jgi:hypothetical protein